MACRTDPSRRFPWQASMRRPGKGSATRWMVPDRCWRPGSPCSTDSPSRRHCRRPRRSNRPAARQPGCSCFARCCCRLRRCRLRCYRHCSTENSFQLCLRRWWPMNWRCWSPECCSTCSRASPQLPSLSPCPAPGLAWPGPRTEPGQPQECAWRSTDVCAVARGGPSGKQSGPTRQIGTGLDHDKTHRDCRRALVASANVLRSECSGRPTVFCY